jgi:glycosyltransferase involved in cell wall biosynthesis
MAGAAEGGAELFFERLCIALHREGETVLPAIRPNPARDATLRAAGLDPAGFAFGPPLDLLTRPRLRAALRRFAPEVAVFWMNRANQHAPAGDWVSVGRLGGYYDLKYYRGRDHLIGNTRGIVSWLRRAGWPAERTHYLPNFVADFAAEPQADRAALGVPRHEKLLLGLGRLHTDKGFDTLIRALPRIPHTTLALAGAGPEQDALRDLARREGVAGRVRFLGWRQDAGRLLKAADVFVCASRIEPLGNMVLEAWSASCPVVAVAAAGPAELIRDGGDGKLVPHEDPAALATAIAAVLEDAPLATALAQAGRARFESEFAASPVLAAWRAFLNGVRR